MGAAVSAMAFAFLLLWLWVAAVQRAREERFFECIGPEAERVAECYAEVYGGTRE